MSNTQNKLKKIPQWIWYSLIPTFGSLAIIYAGNKAKIPKWIYIGIGFLVFSILLSSSKLIIFVWLAQITTAFSFKKIYLIRTASKRLSINDLDNAKLIAQHQGKIELNSCSQDDLVYTLGLPIVYANDILSLAREGYIFTHLEELTEVAGIPASYLQKIEPLITFHYDLHKEADVSWRRLNSCSLNELIAYNIETSVAERIVTERTKGAYKSLIDVRKRTGIPLSAYRHLM